MTATCVRRVPMPNHLAVTGFACTQTRLAQRVVARNMTLYCYVLTVSGRNARPRSRPWRQPTASDAGRLGQRAAGDERAPPSHGGGRRGPAAVGRGGLGTVLRSGGAAGDSDRGAGMSAALRLAD